MSSEMIQNHAHYRQCLGELKARFRQVQLKAAVAGNTALGVSCQISQQPVVQFGQPVGRVSPQGVTRQTPVTAADVGLRCANPTYTLRGQGYEF